jgi:hypothetical protein
MLEHIPEDQAELYSLGELSGEALNSCEDHLLVCKECRAIVARTDSFVLAMRTAAGQLRTRDAGRPARRWVFTILVPAFAALLLTVLWMTARNRGAAISVPLALQLHADRGPANAHAISGARLSLQPDLKGLPFGPYEMELVNAAGQPQWRRAVDFRSISKVEAPPLKSGAYFIRIYSPQGELKREYVLIVDPS